MIPIALLIFTVIFILIKLDSPRYPKSRPISEMTYSEILQETKDRRKARAKTLLSRWFSTSTL